MKVILLGKDRPGFREAAAELRQRAEVQCLDIVLAGPGAAMENLKEQNWACDILISYLAPFVLPQLILDQVRRRAVNFHPGPPEYPGTGCTNFALYEEAKVYGVTAHLMVRQVDSGPIISVRRFPTKSLESVKALTLRTYEELFLLFQDTLPLLLSPEPLHFCGEEWPRKPFTRQQLEELRLIPLGSSHEEALRRIRATCFPGFKGPEIRVGDFVFELLEPDASGLSRSSRSQNIAAASTTDAFTAQPATAGITNL